MEGEKEKATDSWKIVLHERVIGQEEAVNVGQRTPIIDAARAWNARIRVDPIGSFLFLGPHRGGEDRIARQDPRR